MSIPLTVETYSTHTRGAVQYSIWFCILSLSSCCANWSTTWLIRGGSVRRPLSLNPSFVIVIHRRIIKQGIICFFLYEKTSMCWDLIKISKQLLYIAENLCEHGVITEYTCVKNWMSNSYNQQSCAMYSWNAQSKLKILVFIIQS